MKSNYTLKEFLEVLANCSGDEAIDLISAFQSGSITVENISASDF